MIIRWTARLLIPLAACVLAAATSASGDLAPALPPVITQGPGEEALPEPAMPGIAMEIRSWGHLIEAFSTNGDGDVEYSETRRVDGMYNYDVRTIAFNVGREGFERLEGMVAPIERRTRKGEIECGFVPPDGPYGRLRWRLPGSERTLAIRYGCQKAKGAKTIEMIDALEKVVIDWARNRPVTRIHQVRAPASDR